MPFIYFPFVGAVSLLMHDWGRSTVEIANIGNEGVVGLSSLLADVPDPMEIVAQVATHGLLLDIEAARSLAAQHSTLDCMLQRYAQAMIVQIGQNVVCNRLHRAEARCARWILNLHDRAIANEILITHEILGYTLGVRRATITVAAKVLQSEGLIEYRRGTLTVTNRPGLEFAACECYQIIRDVQDEVFH